jgi:hypothetical protein
VWLLIGHHRATPKSSFGPVVGRARTHDHRGGIGSLPLPNHLPYIRRAVDSSGHGLPESAYIFIHQRSFVQFPSLRHPLLAFRVLSSSPPMIYLATPPLEPVPALS